MPKDAKSYAPRISPSTWEQHRCRIKMLFVDQGKALSKVAETMKTYGLHASESQYERQLKIWGIRKNRTRDEWRLINRVVEERRRQGKDSAVLINGVEQSKEKLDREFARSGYRDYGGMAKIIVFLETCK
ncbi:hypothetical protein J4E86_002668 [Alternaria arbusti]|uniref:uncharacterized protein n=1 Tax=Alternaria arbusti TaxID=232088 RepID=UPI00221E79D0|nr:uncharacterized protein J4E86_002668 [Alternaria arbusti]KAI4958948.1 hypothetical protein J4E86_002668 [Alternaria arbusti]